MGKKFAESICFAGIGDLRRKVTVRIDCARSPAKPAVKKIYGLDGLFELFSMGELRSIWSGFLDGEEILLPHNRLIVRTTSTIVSNREAALRLARTLTTKGNPYFALSDKMDGAIKVEHSFDPDSVRVAYLRFGSGDGLAVKKVLMKVDFALRVRMVNPLEPIDEKFSRFPHCFHNTVGFYRVAKTAFNSLLGWNYCKKHGYFAAPCQSEEEANWRFALNMKLLAMGLDSLPHMNMDYLTFLKRWEFLENDENAPRCQWCISTPKNGWAVLMISRDLSGSAVPYEGLIKAESFVKALPDIVQKKLYDGPRPCFVYRGLMVSLEGRGGFFQKNVEELVEHGLKQLREMISLCNQVETSRKDYESEWNLLTGGFSLKDLYGVEFSHLDKMLSVHWINAIRNDPLSFVDHENTDVREFAQSLISGMPYGS